MATTLQAARCVATTALKSRSKSASSGILSPTHSSPFDLLALASALVLQIVT
jgi:hypothetical protein